MWREEIVARTFSRLTRYFIVAWLLIFATFFRLFFFLLLAFFHAEALLLKFKYSFHTLAFIYLLFRSERYFLVVVIYVVLLSLIKYVDK